MSYTVEEKESFMREALREAEIALEHDEIPIGCVIVKDGEIIGRGHNAREELQRAVMHAEIMAIENANVRQCDDTVADGIQLFGSCLAEKLVGSLTVDGVDHDFPGGNLPDSLKPWSDEGLRGVVDIGSVLGRPLQEHGLDDRLSFEGLYAGDDSVHVVRGLCRTVHLVYIGRVDGVEFQDVVVYL